MSEPSTQHSAFSGQSESPSAMVRAVCAELEELRQQNRALVAACELVLLFHSGAPWTFEKTQQWELLLSAIHQRPGACFEHEATTKVMCDALRAARPQAAAEEKTHA